MATETNTFAPPPTGLASFRDRGYVPAGQHPNEIDRHNHLKAAMVNNADLLISLKEYPHTDVLPRALELVDLCEAMVQGRIHPVAAVADCQNVAEMGAKLLVYADGDAALVQIVGQTGGLQIVLITLRNQATGTDVLTGLGCDLAAQRVVVLKSSQHFHVAFAPLASRVVYSGAPGSVTADLKSLPYRKARLRAWVLQGRRATRQQRPDSVFALYRCHGTPSAQCSTPRCGHKNCIAPATTKGCP